MSSDAIYRYKRGVERRKKTEEEAKVKNKFIIFFPFSLTRVKYFQLRVTKVPDEKTRNVLTENDDDDSVVDRHKERRKKKDIRREDGGLNGGDRKERKDKPKG